MGRLLGHGFKAAAERFATEVRDGLGLGALDRLDPWRLAEDHGVPVCTIGELLGVDGDVPPDEEALDDVSALTVIAGPRRMIVLNDRHPWTRQRSSLSHELAHLLLEHPARPAPRKATGRRWEPELEAEADWLAGALLVPEPAARILAVAGRSDGQVARQFGVSRDLARWRLNATGARRLAANARAKQGRSAPGA